MSSRSLACILHASRQLPNSCLCCWTHAGRRSLLAAMELLHVVLIHSRSDLAVQIFGFFNRLCCNQLASCPWNPPAPQACCSLATKHRMHYLAGIPRSRPKGTLQPAWKGRAAVHPGCRWGGVEPPACLFLCLLGMLLLPPSPAPLLICRSECWPHGSVVQAAVARCNCCVLGACTGLVSGSATQRASVSASMHGLLNLRGRGCLYLTQLRS